MSLLLINIKKLLQVRSKTEQPLRGDAMNEVPTIPNAYLLINNGIIAAYGAMQELPATYSTYKTVDCTDYLIGPGYVDSHTHLVFAATREKEFQDRINGLTYEEIAARGGGILNSAAKLASMSEDDLFHDALERLQLLNGLGTTAIEIKSGYGLSLEAELKMLRVIKRLKQETSLIIKATFLGAHAIPVAYKNDREGYLNLIIKELLPVIEKEHLADYIDVFCEKNYFTVDEMIQVIEAGKKHGLKAKVHVNQFNAIEAVTAAVDAGAVSVDHLEVMNQQDYRALSGSDTIATALPSCSFFLGIPYAPVKEMISQDIAVALATDFNPGSTPSGNMNYVFSLACIKMRMTVEQAYNAITVNASHALELQDQVGSITVGKRADLVFYKGIDSLATIPYHFGHSTIDQVMINGNIIDKK